MSDRIITRHVKPPIPDFRWDWCAYHECDEERSYRYGWGSTEQEALEDLRQLDREQADVAETLSRDFL